MRVIKRTGEVEVVSFDKVLNRLRVIANLYTPLDVDVFDIAQKVCSRIFDMVQTSDLDELAAQICSSMIVDNPDYGVLAARIIVSNHHKNTSPSFSEAMGLLFNNVDNHGDHNPMITEELYEIVMKNKEKLNSIIDYSRDYTFDYFGFKTLEKAYLMKVKGKVVERPQYMFMRVALGIHGNDVKDAIKTYELMSSKYFTHATPTLFNAGTPRPQLSSCFLLSIDGDSIAQIFDSLKECALISKHAGGIGIHVHSIRSKGSIIRGTNGSSNGLVPMLKVFNNTARYVDQGGGKRAGSIAVYLEPWHADVMEFLELKKPHGSEEDRARDLFYALWIPDLFMERVRDNGKWSLMCPDMCPGLADCWGDEFKRLYERYEREGRYVKQVDAQHLWFKICECQIESGVPYLLYKDAANSKSNQKNLGTIKSSNLCVAPETMILTDAGYFPIVELKDKAVNVWNGKEFSRTVAKQTGRQQKLITIKFDNGMEIRCTPYHKFYIETGTRPAQKSRPIIIDAKDLNIGMKIIRYETPTINSQGESLKYAYTQGLFAADGTYSKYEEDEKHQCSYQKWENTDFCKRHQTFEKKYDSQYQCCAESMCDKPYIWLYGEKKKLLQYIDWRYHNQNDAADRIDVSVPHDIQNKYFVPLNNNLESKIRWLEGYLDGDGCIVEYNGIKNIQVSSTNKNFLTNVFYMLQTIGVTSNISLSQKEGYKYMPDGNGGKKKYYCENLYRLNIDCSSLIHLKDLGFSSKRLNIDNIRPPHHKTNKFVRISSIEDSEDYDDTYCFNEPKEHKGIFNGILTGQCTEIIEYSSPDETAVCNLSSICLPTFVENGKDGKRFNFEKLHDVSMVVTKNLNKVIDVNFYPVEKARKSNLRHRPIGIGVQGLADAYVLMGYSFDSEQAAQLNKDIFETIYHAAVEQSMLISKRRHELIEEFNESKDEKIIEYLKLNEFDPIFDGQYPGAYSTFAGSPAHDGILQFDMWGVKPVGRYDWTSLKEDIKKYGMRNSLLLAPMPTASTSQIMGFNEACEAFTSNIYKRKTLAGEFILVNKYLLKDLISLGLWSKDMKNKIIINEGSVQDIEEIPQDVKDLYKTVWELKQKHIIDQAKDRGAFICQSQSMNLFLEEPNFKQLSSMHFYSWQAGLKTGIYYLRSKPKAKQIKFTMDPLMQKQMQEEKEKKKPKNVVCTDEVCTSCGS